MASRSERRGGAPEIASVAPAARDLPALTGLRFFLAMWVLSYHTEQTITPTQGYVPVMHDGYLGVDVFFILSGFILAHVYGPRFAAHEPGLYRRFVWLRFARVWPAYATALLATALMQIVRANFGSGIFKIEHPIAWTWQLARHLAMVQSWGLADFYQFNLPGWSLSAEWAAYLLFPLFLLVARGLKRGPLLALGMAVGFVSLYAVFRLLGHPDLDKPGDNGMMRLAAEFFAGVALCMMTTPRRFARLGDIAALGGAVVSVTMLATWGHDHPLEGDVLALPLFVLMVWGCTQDGPLVRRLLSNRPMLFLGAASYSIYLIQSPVDDVFELIAGRLHLHGPAELLPVALLSAAAAIVAGCIVLVLVERPWREALRRFIG